MITAGVPRSERTYVGAMAARGEPLPEGRAPPPRAEAFAEAWRDETAGPPNAFTYTALIDAQVKGGALEEAFATYDRMKRAGVAPTVVTFGCLLNACRVALLEAKKKKGEGEKEASAGASETASDASEALNSRAVSRAYDLLGEMTALGVCPNDRCQNALVRVVSEAGRVDDTLDAVKRRARGGVRPRAPTLEGVVRALCRAGYAERALRILSWMETRAGTSRTRRRSASARARVRRGGPGDVGVERLPPDAPTRAPPRPRDGVRLVAALCRAVHPRA